MLWCFAGCRSKMLWWLLHAGARCSGGLLDAGARCSGALLHPGARCGGKMRGARVSSLTHDDDSSSPKVKADSGFWSFTWSVR